MIDRIHLASGPSAFTYGGDIVDDQGKPISGVEVTATYQRNTDSYGYIDVVKTDPHGHFLIDRERALSGAHPANVTEETIRLEFRHPDYAYANSEDLQTLSQDEVTRLKVTLSEGRAVQGKVVDTNRQPVVAASVKITFGSDYKQRRGTTTDATGRFQFRGLPNEAGTVHVLTVAQSQPMLTAYADVDATQTDASTLVATPIQLPIGAPVHELFGMKLVDVDASVQAAFHLPGLKGVLVLDPGNRGRVLGVQRGDQFLTVGNDRVADFANFTEQLLTLRTAPEDKRVPGASSGDSVRVVWAFRRAERAGTNTQYLKLDAADVSALSAMKTM